MVKNSYKKIQDDKNRVLDLLTENSRLSAHEMSKRLGFSRQKVWKLIKDLEKENKIWGYTSVIGDQDDDYKIFFALIKQSVPYIENAEKIVKNVKNDNSKKLDIKLLGLYYTNGQYDGICMFAAKSLKDAKKYLGYMMTEYKDYITAIDLTENVFPMVHYGKPNPKLEKLKDFSLESVDV
jgi:DNA-binding Lrp family transcriptional regulator